MRRLALFLFSHRLLAIARWDVHFIGVRLKNFVTAQQRQVTKFAATRDLPVLLNLGSGPRGKNDRHWVNVDGFSDRNVHFVLDFSRRLAFADATFDGAFSEHVFEHFTLEDAQKLASEIVRILKPGGTLRVIVPDAETIMREYFEDPQALLMRRAPAATPAEAVNSYFRQNYEHQFLYDHETLSKMLIDAGFAKVNRLAFATSSSGMPIAIDDPKYKWESLYVEAVKA